MATTGETPNPIQPVPTTTRFPKLTGDKSYVLTSDPSEDYNCFAFAAGMTNKWWGGIYYWPHGVPIDESVRGTIRLYEHFGFQCCESPDLEDGFVKIALHARGDDVEHAARQLPDGRWTSKLGPDEDIAHALDSLEGDFYGKVVQFMKKPIT